MLSRGWRRKLIAASENPVRARRRAFPPCGRSPWRAASPQSHTPHGGGVPLARPGHHRPRGRPKRPSTWACSGTPRPPGGVLEQWGRWVAPGNAAHGARPPGPRGRRALPRTGRPPGLHLAEPCDGHATRTPGVLLGGDHRGLRTLSRWWRRSGAWRPWCTPGGAARPRGSWSGASRCSAERRPRSAAESMFTWDPAICGDCYEVGPEVHRRAGAGRPRRPPARGPAGRAGRAGGGGGRRRRARHGVGPLHPLRRLRSSPTGAGDRERQLGVAGGAVRELSHPAGLSRAPAGRGSPR